MAQGQADIIPAIEQAFLAKLIDGKRNGVPIRANHNLHCQIDSQFETRRHIHELEQRLDFVSRHDNRQNAVFKTVIKKKTKKVASKIGKKFNQTIGKKLFQVAKAIVMKLIKMLISLLAALAEFIIPLALILIIIISVFS